LGRGTSRKGREEEKVMGGEYDQSTLYMYESSIMKPTKNCFKRGVKKEK
jgi:hypothetical protein